MKRLPDFALPVLELVATATQKILMDFGKCSTNAVIIVSILINTIFSALLLIRSKSLKWFPLFALAVLESVATATQNILMDFGKYSTKAVIISILINTTFLRKFRIFIIF